MSQDTIRTAVLDRYAAIARDEASGCGCGPSCCGGDTETLASLDIGYTEEELAGIPGGANLGLGSGHPTAAADIQTGETVLDLGSGAGIDCFLAAKAVGPSGRVIGVDMTADMVSRARQNASEGGFDNVEFRLGEIEALPVGDSTVDVIVSNCVINLSTSRGRVFEEAHRVLKSGGRLVVSDLLSEGHPPEVLQEFPEIVSGCLPIPQEDYLAGLELAGFTSVEIIHEKAFSADKLPIDAEVRQRVEAAGGQLEGLAAYTGSARSAIIRAIKS